MNIVGPDRYKLKFDSRTFSVTCPRGTSEFSGRANDGRPKLYIVSRDNIPIYVGITVQRMRQRLRYGWRAAGETGYYGYAWRHLFVDADLDVWLHENPPAEKPCLHIETIEAEVVYLIRTKGQWPSHQTEIHFHPSTDTHRRITASILANYDFN